MESITNVAQTASKYIFGDKPQQSGEEPVAGVKGKGTPDDPYDAGNQEDYKPPVSSQPTSHEEPLSEVTDKGISDKPYDTGSQEDYKPSVPPKAASTNTEPEIRIHVEEKSPTPIAQPVQKPIGGERPTDGPIVPDAPAPKESAFSEDLSPNKSLPKEPTFSEDISPKEPAFPKEPEFPKESEFPKEPEFSKEPAFPKESALPKEPELPAEPKAKNEEPLAKGNTDDYISEPSKLNDSQSNSSIIDKDDGIKSTPDYKEGVSGEELKNREADEKGTGEKWVKSTGLAADGGDFDASQPGAGREADRLLEEKGVQKGDSSDGSGSSGSHDQHDVKKTSITKKLKEKLHIGSGKHA